MTRREMVLTVVGIFVVSLVARAYFAAQIVFPKPEDTAYYVGVARNLLEGRGLVSDALWSYQTPPLVFPRPAFEVWLPLPTFLAAIPMAIFGTTFPAAQVSSVIVGALVPVLTWRLALDVAEERGLDLERTRWIGIGAGLTTAVYLPLLLSSALPDSTMPFAVIVLGACLLMTRIVRDPRGATLTDPRLIALGVLLGLGALTRNETVWLAIIWAAMAWFLVHRPARERIWLIGVVAVVAAVVFAPWALRNLLVLGSPLPGQAVTNALYLSGFDIFAWNDPPTLARHLAIGPAALVELRIAGLAHNLFNVLVLLGIPVSVIGLVALPWQGRGLVPAAAAPDQPDHVLRHQPALPGSDPVGHVPARSRAGARPDRHLGHPRRSMPAWPDWAAGWTGPTRSPGSGPRWDSGRPSSSRWPCCPSSAAGRTARRTCMRSSARGWRRSAGPSTRAPDRSSPTSRSGWPRPSASRRSPSRTNRPRTSWTWRGRSQEPA